MTPQNIPIQIPQIPTNPPNLNNNFVQNNRMNPNINMQQYQQYQQYLIHQQAQQQQQQQAHQQFLNPNQNNNKVITGNDLYSMYKNI